MSLEQVGITFGTVVEWAVFLVCSTLLITFLVKFLVNYINKTEWVWNK